MHWRRILPVLRSSPAATDRLWEAVLAGELPELHAALDAGAFIDAENNARDYNTPLAWAAMSGPDYVALALIERGADVNAQGVNGITPLMHAAYNGRVGVVRALIRRGADVTAKTPDGDTALGHARACRSAALRDTIVAMLRQAGARE